MVAVRRSAKAQARSIVALTDAPVRGSKKIPRTWRVGTRGRACRARYRRRAVVASRGGLILGQHVKGGRRGAGEPRCSSSPTAS